MALATMNEVTERHTDEIVEKVVKARRMFELVTDEVLTEREKAIFEIAYANGYHDGVSEVRDGVEVQVLKK